MVNRLAPNCRSGLHRAALLRRRLIAGLTVVALTSLCFVVVGELPAGATTTYEVTALLASGKAAGAAASDVNTGFVYVANLGDGTIDVINGATNTDVADINLGIGTQPQAVAVDPSTNTIYVADYGTDQASVINGATNTVSATISMSPDGDPEGIGVDLSNDTVYVSLDTGDLPNTGVIAVINGETNTITKTISTGTSVPYAVAVDQSNGDVSPPTSTRTPCR